MACKQDMNFKSICLCESGKVADCKLNFFCLLTLFTLYTPSMRKLRS